MFIYMAQVVSIEMSYKTKVGTQDKYLQDDVVGRRQTAIEKSGLILGTHKSI
jgi:hypothetical protein